MSAPEHPEPAPEAPNRWWRRAQRYRRHLVDAGDVGDRFGRYPPGHLGGTLDAGAGARPSRPAKRQRKGSAS